MKSGEPYTVTYKGGAREGGGEGDGRRGLGGNREGRPGGANGLHLIRVEVLTSRAGRCRCLHRDEAPHPHPPWAVPMLPRAKRLREKVRQEQHASQSKVQARAPPPPPFFPTPHLRRVPVLPHAYGACVVDCVLRHRQRGAARADEADVVGLGRLVQRNVLAWGQEQGTGREGLVET